MEIPESMEVREQKVDDLARNEPFEKFVEGTIVAVTLSMLELIRNNPDDKPYIAKQLTEIVDTATSKIVLAKESSE